MAKRPPLLRSRGSYSQQSLPRPAPFATKGLDTDRLPSYMNEKITLEPDTWSSKRSSKRFSVKPDIGDQRNTTLKTLPKPPLTPKRVIRKYRVSAALMGVLALLSFTLSLVVLLAGKEAGYLEDVYMMKLDTSKAGQNIIRFDTVSSITSAPPTASSSSSSSPADALNPFSTASPLNPDNPSNPLNRMKDALEPIIEDLTDSLNDGLGDAINQVVDAFVNEADVKAVYTLYISGLCKRNQDDAAMKCLNYPDALAALHRTALNLQFSPVIGRTKISIPLITELSSSADSLLGTLNTIRRALLAFIVISLIGSGITFTSAIPSLLFRDSRLLIYINVFVAHLSSLFAFVVALLLTVLVLGTTSLVGKLGKVLGLNLERGNMMLTLLWVSWVAMVLVGAYWGVVWFVEVRRSSFMRRTRTDEEVGNWSGMKKEVWRDIRREKRQ